MIHDGNVAFFEGSHFEIGKQLGEWWVERIDELEDEGKNGNENVQKFLNKKAARFKLRLKDGWENRYSPLLRYAYANFPEIMEEIAGMVVGINHAGWETGWETSIENVFMYAVGEVWGCSSILIPIEDGFLLGHNEEDDQAYPLCFAEVHVNGTDTDLDFVSVSYPFQLFGSVAGMNRSMAFQGNSIGTSGKIRKLQSSWNKRAPKTFFTRQMLECHGIQAVKKLYKSHHAALPSHHFVAFKTEAYSLEIRPCTDVDSAKSKQLIKAKKLGKNKESIHTNHFVGDEDWKWGDSYDDNSETRHASLQKIFEGKESNEPNSILKKLKGFKENPDNDVESSTSASLCFEITPKSNSLNALPYFGEDKSQKIVAEL